MQRSTASRTIADPASRPAHAHHQTHDGVDQRKCMELRLAQSDCALREALDEGQTSRAKLRQVFDTIPALAWCNLPDGPNEFMNKRWHQYTGLSPEESHGWGWRT